ncbi:MAG: hypothetical protein K4571_17550 [Deltaproteobacteria bacterium]
MEVNERDFFREPFTPAEIDVLLGGKPASEMFSFRSPSFKALGLSRAELVDKDLVDLMLKEPRLIRRPIVRIGRQVYFGADDKMLAGIL